jgi:hypothetical protein
VLLFIRLAFVARLLQELRRPWITAVQAKPSTSRAKAMHRLDIGICSFMA